MQKYSQPAHLHEPKTNERRREHLSKPPGVLKLNCDASFHPRSMSGSWDSDGDVVLAGSGRVNHLLSAFQAEMIACLLGLQAAINAGVRRLIMETDASMVQQDHYSYSTSSGLVEEVKSLVDSNL